MAAELADVLYRGQKAGVVFWDKSRRTGVFEYTREFAADGEALAPLQMPLRSAPFQFPNIHESFSGLPGLLADCLPDTYGNALIDEWLRRQNRNPTEFSPVERLCYIGSRGMGALEFQPAARGRSSKAEHIEIEQLVELASQALASKGDLNTSLQKDEDLNEILRVGTSAGGARAKAVIAWNADTNEVRSGQAEVPPGFEHWLLKFDGVDSSFDGVRDPQGYGRIEYAYSLMAVKAGIEMMPCRLFEEGERAHFMTRRFDRCENNEKTHFASLFGIAHFPYAAPGSHSLSYEDYFQVIERLKLSPEDRLEAFRRMAFNILGCNRDDHSKNFGFLMSKAGAWRLSPAYDVTYAFNPLPGKWTATQQMSVLGKREGITCADMIEAGKNAQIATLPKLKKTLDEVISALGEWNHCAESAQVSEENTVSIQRALTQQTALR